MARAGLESIVKKGYNDPVTGKTPRLNDAMQMMIDCGDPKEHNRRVLH